MNRSELEMEITAMERAGKLLPEDATEVRRFADYLEAMSQARKGGSAVTLGELYDKHYPEHASAPLPEAPESQP